ncbi:hypothetical protein P154DRAFT_490584 [Amniculicola lignicola CBS 123094]|uniref:Peptidase S33 tripeptidyl aminopeptidase-like C-terminal domain-containing protein n=1 Tax=Amniculicola lignicola CBS 123094 TaxID=1392246 RepID=A0A6A5WHR3_9PLEO|nr:hypothetical protein P154DRAFT_490584 [Amniculicola lignicola CBS 123094]
MKGVEYLDQVSLILPERKKGYRPRALLATVATCLVIFAPYAAFPDQFREFDLRLQAWWRGDVPSRRYEAEFRWSDIEPSDSLKFIPCYGDFECAKLKLPLDYFNGTYPDETVSVAITKLPAQVPVDDPRYGGPMLINPGGPGGAGTLLALGWGRDLQIIVDSADNPHCVGDWNSKKASTAKYYDIIGFDPRGIGMTEPSATCLPSSSAWSWRLREQEEGILGSSDAALGRLWSMSHAYGESCKRGMEDGPDIKQYMSTASVARDMLEIAEKHAEYNAKTVTDLLATRSTQETHEVNPEVSIYKRGDVKLQYWGFSYGTYLGYTFASMFPDRVGRVLLDGVVNSDDYNQGLGNGSLRDAEKDRKTFYTWCSSSGPEACPLTTDNSTAEDIETRVRKIVQSTLHHPVAIPSDTGPEILTFSDLVAVIFRSIYEPRSSFPILASLLAALEANDQETLEIFTEGLKYSHVYSCPIDGGETGYTLNDVPQNAILCSDSEDLTGEDIDSFREYWSLLDSISETSGGIWAMLRMRCASWKIKAVHRFEKQFGGNTSYPILFISNTADPVTPLRSGRIMSARFPGSALLVQDSAGHCSSSTPTPCTMSHIKAYFQTGALPKPDTLCIPPASPFNLNSTDPSSPFYDKDLFTRVMGEHGSSLAPTTIQAQNQIHIDEKAVQMFSQMWDMPEEEFMVSREGMRLMGAGEGLRRWVKRNRFWGVGGSERVEVLMGRGRERGRGYPERMGWEGERVW